MEKKLTTTNNGFSFSLEPKEKKLSVEEITLLNRI